MKPAALPPFNTCGVDAEHVLLVTQHGSVADGSVADVWLVSHTSHIPSYARIQPALPAATYIAVSLK